ncbi:MAG: 5-formyltetrahydrofolate cyclo-ligase [Elusimicrobia bacterium RIFCSPLOWO2_01_FULL_59_12]|nr:MAG: 5-formyltetrahydrofolate cyclo-ligase [Elusimicrobia bacterium RIFCSPLOWO2_01_FULL_59_12]
MEKQNKTSLRKEFLKKRDRLTPAARARDSAIIRQRVLAHPEWQDVHTLLTYVSYRSEVETYKLIQEAIARRKRVVVPVMDPESKELRLSELHALGDLAPGAFHGIQEPAPCHVKRVIPMEIELVLVPGVAFDRQGGRIGLGGGYFDKLLDSMPNARRVGLAFSAQISKRPLPMAAHDIRMHAVVTEKEVIPVK